MAQYYMKLDWNWADTPEACLLRKLHGRKALLDWIQLMVAMSMFGGAFDSRDEMQMDAVKQLMRKNEQGVLDAVGKCAECGLVDADAWRAFGRAGSARALRDARARDGRKEWGEYMQSLSMAERNAQEEGDKRGGNPC